MKILHFIYGLGVGGAETFISNVLSKLNPDEYHFDFALQDGNIKNDFLSDYIEKNNSAIYILLHSPGTFSASLNCFGIFCVKTITIMCIFI